jgi:hypothetical protein
MGQAVKLPHQPKEKGLNGLPYALSIGSLSIATRVLGRLWG